jgi:hypothetical protein
MAIKAQAPSVIAVPANSIVGFAHEISNGNWSCCSCGGGGDDEDSIFRALESALQASLPDNETIMPTTASAIPTYITNILGITVRQFLMDSEGNKDLNWWSDRLHRERTMQDATREARRRLPLYWV